MSDMMNVEKNIKYYNKSMSQFKNKHTHIGLYTEKANENHLFIFKDNNAFMRYFIPNIQKLKTSSTGKKIVLYEINDAGLLYLIQYWERNSDLSLPNFSLPMPSLYKNSEGAMYIWDNEKINECLMKNIPITNDKLRKMIGRELIDKQIFAIHVVNKKMLIHDGISRRLSFTCPLDKNGCISKKIVMSKLKPHMFLTNYFEIISTAFHIDNEKEKLRKEKDILLKRLKEIQEQESSDKDNNQSSNDVSDEDIEEIKRKTPIYESEDDDLDSEDLDSDYSDSLDDDLDSDEDNIELNEKDLKTNTNKLNVLEESNVQTKEKQKNIESDKKDEKIKEDLSKSLNVMLNTNSVKISDVDIIPDTEDIINIATPDTIPIYENNSLPSLEDTQEYISLPDDDKEDEIENKVDEEQLKPELDIHTSIIGKKKRKKNTQSYIKKKKSRKQ